MHIKIKEDDLIELVMTSWRLLRKIEKPFKYNEQY